MTTLSEHVRSLRYTVLGENTCEDIADDIKELEDKLATSEKDCDEQSEEILELRSRLDTLTGERDGWKEISDDAMAELKAARSRLDEQSKQLAQAERMARGWQDKLYDVQAAVQRCEDSEAEDKAYQLWRYLRELFCIAKPCSDAWHTYHKPGTSCGTCGVVEIPVTNSGVQSLDKEKNDGNQSV